MGIIRTAINAVGGALADSWLEAIECSDMGDSTVFCRGTMVHSGDGRHGNKKKTVDTVSNGSKIHVGHNQFMLLVDGGKVVEQGTHDTLMAMDGFYRKLYEAQFDSVA